MYKIRLNDGTEFDARFCGERNGQLTVGINTAASFLTVAQKFSTAAQSVTFLYDTSEERFVGYTKLLAIINSEDDAYNVTLKKEA